MIKVHEDGMAHARALIAHGKVSGEPFTLDAADRAAMLGPKGTDADELGRHHLGVDDSAEPGDHRAYRYAFAKEGRCYSRALLSIADRAREHGHDECRAAALDLLGMMDDGGDGQGDGADTGQEMKSLHDEAEKRYVMGVELRASAPAGADGNGPGMVVGYAAVFNRPSGDLGGFREIIRPGAFAGCMGDDVRALANHDPSQLLGRNGAGTMRMTEDAVGLRVEIDLPDTQAGRDIATSIRRGDMDGMSFSFTIAPGDDDWDFTGAIPLRTINRFRKCYDIGPVTYPAYPDTSAAVRSLDRARQQTRRMNPQRPPAAADLRYSLQLARARQALAEALLTP